MTIRRCVLIGLMSTPQRTYSGYRYYSSAEVDQATISSKQLSDSD
ncbi:hypothetical protein [Mycobacterium lepromatosis]